MPDPFREGREVIVTGKLDEDGIFMAEKDSLITKCPSKFADEAAADPEHVSPIEPATVITLGSAALIPALAGRDLRRASRR